MSWILSQPLIFAKECWDRFSEIYSDPDFRHSYYTISSCLEKYDPAQRDSLPVYLDRVVEVAEMQGDSAEVRRTARSVKKLSLQQDDKHFRTTLDNGFGSKAVTAALGEKYMTTEAPRLIIKESAPKPYCKI